jgi:DNA replication protein DnaC
MLTRPLNDTRIDLGRPTREHFRVGTNRRGKSFVACALTPKACRDGYSVLYTRAQSPFRDLATARGDGGSLRALLARLGRIDVLVLDDWAMPPLSKSEHRDFWEDLRGPLPSTFNILTAQLPVSRWHEKIGDPAFADGILDRLVHNAHRIEMRGDSMRKSRAKPSA